MKNFFKVNKSFYQKQRFYQPIIGKMFKRTVCFCSFKFNVLYEKLFVFCVQNQKHILRGLDNRYYKKPD